MPKLDFKVKKRRVEFCKNQLLHAFNAKFCMGRANHGQKIVVGVADDHQKKFQPFLSISWFSKKIIKTAKFVKITKNQDFYFFGT